MCASDGLRCILYLEIYASEYYGNFLLSSGLPQAGETLSVNKKPIFVAVLSKKAEQDAEYDNKLIADATKIIFDLIS